MVQFYLNTDVEIIKAKLQLWYTKLDRNDKCPKNTLDYVMVKYSQIAIAC